MPLEVPDGARVFGFSTGHEVSQEFAFASVWSVGKTMLADGCSEIFATKGSHQWVTLLSSDGHGSAVRLVVTFSESPVDACRLFPDKFKPPPRPRAARLDDLAPDERPPA